MNHSESPEQYSLPTSTVKKALGVAAVCVPAGCSITLAGCLVTTVVCLIMVAACLTMLSKYTSTLWHPTIKSASGTYIGHYAGGTETFHLYPDGRFDQTFVKSKKTVYTNAGRFAFEDDGDIYFSGSFVAASDIYTGHPEKYTKFNEGTFGYDTLSSTIVFDDDKDIYAEKVSP
jgi:hypothetical protein